MESIVRLVSDISLKNLLPEANPNCFVKNMIVDFKYTITHNNMQ